MLSTDSELVSVKVHSKKSNGFSRICATRISQERLSNLAVGFLSSEREVTDKIYFDDIVNECVSESTDASICMAHTVAIVMSKHIYVI